MGKLIKLKDRQKAKVLKPNFPNHQTSELSARLTRIRKSLERVNRLMSELKRLEESTTNNYNRDD